MNRLTVRAGNSIKASELVLRRHPELQCEMAYLHIEFGDEFELSIDFRGWDEAIEFCKKHNFEYRFEGE